MFVLALLKNAMSSVSVLIDVAFSIVFLEVEFWLHGEVFYDGDRTRRHRHCCRLSFVSPLHMFQVVLLLHFSSVRTPNFQLLTALIAQILIGYFA